MSKQPSIPQSWNVPHSFRARFSDVAGHQRAMSDEGHLLLVLHAPPQLGSHDRELRLFWRSADGHWKASTMGQGVESLEAHIADYETRVNRLEAWEQSAEGSDDYFRVRREITPLRRAAHNMYEAIQAGLDACPDDRELLARRNQAGTIERAADLLYEDAQHGLDYAIAKQTEQQALAGRRLNLMAAFFFPIATLASVFGMNLTNGIEHVAGPGLFWAVLVAGLLMGFAVTSLIAGKQISRSRRQRRDPNTGFKAAKYS
jgi:hypothetical protein